MWTKGQLKANITAIAVARSQRARCVKESIFTHCQPREFSTSQREEKPLPSQIAISILIRRETALLNHDPCFPNGIEKGHALLL